MKNKSSDLKKVLIVDDDQFMRDYISSILMVEGVKADFARNGAEALEVLKNTAPDIILLDLFMPKMDGFEFCRRYREDASLNQVPIVIISSSPRHENQEGLHSFEVSDYVEKSLISRDLVVKITKIIEDPESYEEISFQDEGDKYFKVIMECGHMGAGTSNEIVRYLKARDTVELFDDLKNHPGLKSKGTTKHISLVKPISQQEYESGKVLE